MLPPVRDLMSRVRFRDTGHGTDEFGLHPPTLAWGVRAECLPPASGTDAVVGEVVAHLREQGLRKGDRAVLVMGGAKDPAGATTLIKLETL